MKAIKIILAIILGLCLICGGFAIANELHQNAMNEYIDSFGRVEIENQLVPELDEAGRYYFTTDGDFKVMQITDVHIGGGILSGEKDKKAINAVAAMITAEKPDMVVVTGDISFAVPWAGTINNKYAHEYFKRLMENLGVYWTVTFGNHDSEIYDYYNRAAVAEMYEDEAMKYCLFSSEDGGVWGECNHVINVKNSLGVITQSLIMMDTNSYTDEDPLGIKWIYDNIHEDQIEWYRDTVTELNAYNKTIISGLDTDEYDGLTTVKSLLFIHIPLMEVRQAVEVYLGESEAMPDGLGEVEYIRGKIGEKSPYVYCSEDEEMMFETMLSLSSTQAMFYGHDHLNNILLECSGIKMSYGYSIDYFAYAGIDKLGSQRGCTVITCHSDSTLEITHENYYQDKYQPLYEKEVVDMTN